MIGYNSCISGSLAIRTKYYHVEIRRNSYMLLLIKRRSLTWFLWLSCSCINEVKFSFCAPTCLLYTKVCNKFTQMWLSCCGIKSLRTLGIWFTFALAAAIRVTRAAHLQILQLLQLLAGRLGFKPTWVLSSGVFSMNHSNWSHLEPSWASRLWGSSYRSHCFIWQLLVW